jgi:hypothetical protein
LNIYKIFDLAILVLVGLFLLGLGVTEYKTFGLEQPIFESSKEWKSFFEFLIWPIIGLLVIDLGVKYKKTNDPKKFVKKYWIDIIMLVLIPAFSIFKFFKLGIGIAKKLKTVKMGVKAVHKTKKVTQN